MDLRQAYKILLTTYAHILVHYMFTRVTTYYYTQVPYGAFSVIAKLVECLSDTGVFQAKVMS